MNHPTNKFLLLIWMICPGLIFAQQQQTYYGISYYKAVPDKEDELHSMMRTWTPKFNRRG